MLTLQPFVVELRTLRTGNSEFTWKAGRQFFEEFGDSGILDADITVTALVSNHGLTIGVKAAIAGSVTVPCDRCLENLAIPVDSSFEESYTPESNILDISAEEFKSSNESASGMTSDIGIQYEPINDTITIIEVIPGGPSAKVGLKAGDRIVSIDDTTTIGEKVTKGAIAKRLRGPKGSKVKLGIKRLNSDKTLTFTVTRGNIPVNTVDAHYMLDKNTGYVKVNQFGRNTYREFMQAMIKLKDEGAKRYMIDLRGNGGGFMEMAVRMVNEFLPANQLIVYTHGRYKRNDREWWSDGDGRFQDAEVAVLIDEFSASASEIFAGALQDNDRGLIVGCRSFGKGLVQKEFVLPDSSAIRLTTARYYTPSGRCIQKDFKRGANEEYEQDVCHRPRPHSLWRRRHRARHLCSPRHERRDRLLHRG